MVFTQAQLRYLRGQEIGRLATIGPGGPQNHPVWFRVTPVGVDIGGTQLSDSRKYRNVLADPRVSFVVDDVLDGHGRGVELRGCATIHRLDSPLFPGFELEVLRIRARRVIAWSIDVPGYHRRDR
ncbi:pyridoxamine 5'-phosphate oxidase family protein [Sciscionella sediminilitoris]|uniref:pyridoxamine 5'-phosphate oxidase family protein n=1 Tax=Sciscionella sediminilitoris TaxID=1445613 RepID=UPI0004DEF44D|nr:pyridoxamine 5'-phosphate oxidase family protein [Sciscionella sp. SE31]